MDNIPGIIKIEYILAKNTKEIIYTPGQVINFSDYINTGSLTELSFVNTAELNYDVSEEDPGDIYQANISFRIAGITPSKTELLNKLRNRSYVFITTDTEGQKYSIGTKNYPAKFNYSSVTDNPTGWRGYECEITAETPFPLIIVTV